MELSEFLVRLLLIFFPGIISMKIVDMLTAHQRKDLNTFFLNSFVLGMSSYFVRHIIILAMNVTPWFEYKLFFLDFLTDKKANIVWIEVIWSSVTSVFLGFVIAAIINYKIVYRLARRFKISKQSGENDVWGYIFRSSDVRWVLIRDYNKNQMYEGWVEAFSDMHVDNELFIRDVTVYNMDDSSVLYTVSGLYITKGQDDIEIEFREQGSG